MTILELMKRRWAAAEEVEALTVRLSAAQRAARDTADALSDALSRESGERLCTILALEAAARRKTPGKDVSLPGRRVQRGRKHGR